MTDFYYFRRNTWSGLKMIQCWRVHWDWLHSFHLTKIIALSFLLIHPLRWVRAIITVLITVLLMIFTAGSWCTVAGFKTLTQSAHWPAVPVCHYPTSPCYKQRRQQVCVPYVLKFKCIVMHVVSYNNCQFSWRVQTAPSVGEKLLGGPRSEKVY